MLTPRRLGLRKNDPEGVAFEYEEIDPPA